MPLNDLRLRIGNAVILPSRDVKYLGVTFCRDGSFCDHIRLVCWKTVAKPCSWRNSCLISAGQDSQRGEFFENACVCFDVRGTRAGFMDFAY